MATGFHANRYVGSDYGSDSDTSRCSDLEIHDQQAGSLYALHNYHAILISE